MDFKSWDSEIIITDEDFMSDAKKIDACPVCTTPCTIEGHTTKHYKPIPRELDVKKIVRILEKRHHKNMLFDCLECGERVRYTRPAVPSKEEIKEALYPIMKKELISGQYLKDGFCWVCGEPTSEEKRLLLIDVIADAIHKKWGGV